MAKVIVSKNSKALKEKNTVNQRDMDWLVCNMIDLADSLKNEFIRVGGSGVALIYESHFQDLLDLMKKWKKSYLELHKEVSHE